MTEVVSELERRVAEPVEVDRPWMTKRDRAASIGLTLIMVLGGPIQVFFAPSWWESLLSALTLIGFTYPFAMSAVTKRDYFRFPFRYPLVTEEELPAWEAMLAKGYPASADEGKAKEQVAE